MLATQLLLPMILIFHRHALQYSGRYIFHDRTREEKYIYMNVTQKKMAVFPLAQKLSVMLDSFDRCPAK
jgi:hypothetical protein